MNINVVWGPPASGKTTYTRENRSNNSVTFDFDMLMREISGLGPHEKNNNLIGYLLDIREQIIKRLKSETKLDDAWIIVTWVDDKFRDQFAGLEVEYILMDTPKDICLKRVDENKDRHGAATEMKEVIEKWFEKYEEYYGRSDKMQKLERRYIPVEEIELRQSEEDGLHKLSGYAAVFNKRSENLGGFVEVLRPGAFRKVLESEPDVKFLFNHDPSALLARTKNGTLRLEENTVGLKFEAELADTTTARDVRQLIDRGDIDQCSFAFAVAKDGDKFTEQKEGLYLREIFEIGKFADVSAVTYPAYTQTSVSVRSAKEVMDSHLETLQAQSKEDEYKRAQARRKRETEKQKSMIGGNK